MLNSLSRRLQAHLAQSAEYREFMDEYERLGHTRKTPVLSCSSDQQVYILHHPVFREDSITTRLRVVFNASSPTSNGTCLNDHLLAGPKLQTELPTVVLRWQQFKFVYSADIAKMFRQIQIDQRDINYQKILWKNALSDVPTEFQLLTVTYCMACAPLLALRILQQLASDEGSLYPLAVPILRENIYVDDLLFGSDDIVALRRTRDQLITLLRHGGFQLRKWASNSSLLLSDIDAADHGLACSKLLSTDDSLKILGIGWDPARDVFQIAVSLAESAPVSKRTILSAIARIYPLGWVTPVTITTKIFIQQLLGEKLGWDDVIPQTLLCRWQQIYSRLSCLNGLTVTRWTGFESDVLYAELHGFSDASNQAYSAAVYLKIISKSGKVTITLLAGKSKIARLTPITVPRLELLAAALLARLLEFVKDSCSLDGCPCFCWTDSMIVLAWLNQHPSRWKTFVAHRVADVQTRLRNLKWRHVPTADNPADCASRGLFGDEIISHPLWWQGPSWLHQPPEKWPRIKLHLPVDAPLEKKLISLLCNLPRKPFDLASRYSSWTRLIRVTAYVFRFISLCRRSRTEPHVETNRHAITADECNRAKAFWIRYIEAEIFPNEMFALSNNNELPNKSKILTLRPFLDRDGIIRVGRRLNRAPIPFTARHPILLASHPLVSTIIDQVHQRQLHAGLQLTLRTLRNSYWIIRARSFVKTRIHRCVICAQERAVEPSQLMGNLPAARVTALSRCFLHCGVDYAGPVQVRASPGRGITSRKAYIALFICLATRAIHLELVGDYSTHAFLNAFSRFSSHRGLPESMYSDNGTTFVGADRELAKSYRATLRSLSEFYGY